MHAQESDEDVVDTEFLLGSDGGDEGGDTPATLTPHHRRQRRAGHARAEGGAPPNAALIDAARRLGGALGNAAGQRMDRFGQVGLRQLAVALPLMGKAAKACVGGDHDADLSMQRCGAHQQHAFAFGEV